MPAMLDRRRLLLGAGGLAGAYGLAACAPFPAPEPVEGPWDTGVASGLHSHDAAVLWTRFAPAVASPVELTWEVAGDPGFSTLVAQGRITVDSSTDGCAKVLAEGLQPGTTHWYRFSVGADFSPVGRTRTLPPPGSEPPSLRLAVASCQKFSSGWYPAWREVAATDLDGVLFLGDYIYESTGKVNPLWDVRDDPSEAATDLETYRAKYRLYRSDPGTCAAHAKHGFAPIWDDHEFVNNYDRLRLVEDPVRAEAAYRAWFEYMPVWPIDGTRIQSGGLRFGSLAHVSLLDTRQYRDPNLEVDGVAGHLAATRLGGARPATDPARVGPAGLAVRLHRCRTRRRRGPQRGLPSRSWSHRYGRWTWMTQRSGPALSTPGCTSTSTSGTATAPSGTGSPRSSTTRASITRRSSRATSTPFWQAPIPSTSRIPQGPWSPRSSCVVPSHPWPWASPRPGRLARRVGSGLRPELQVDRLEEPRLRPARGHRRLDAGPLRHGRSGANATSGASTAVTFDRATGTDEVLLTR
ncbi:MAG: alkaline phosphatase D family protein [Microthrixaceae bacterium]